jgi:hypothetical protein
LLRPKRSRWSFPTRYLIISPLMPRINRGSKLLLITEARRVLRNFIGRRFEELVQGSNRSGFADFSYLTGRSLAFTVWPWVNWPIRWSNGTGHSILLINPLGWLASSQPQLLRQIFRADIKARHVVARSLYRSPDSHVP